MILGLREAADVQSGLQKLREFEAMPRQINVDEHEHRAVIQADDFALLVAGAEVTPHCRCGSYVRLLLADIGFAQMLALVGVAQAGNVIDGPDE